MKTKQSLLESAANKSFEELQKIQDDLRERAQGLSQSVEEPIAQDDAVEFSTIKREKNQKLEFNLSKKGLIFVHKGTLKNGVRNYKDGETVNIYPKKKQTFTALSSVSLFFFTVPDSTKLVTHLVN